MSSRRTNEPSPLEVEGSTAGATGGRDHGDDSFIIAPSGVRQLMLSPLYGLLVVPYCPHEGCSWSMPQFWCPVHGNFGMTFLFGSTGGVLTHVKAVLDVISAH